MYVYRIKEILKVYDGDTVTIKVDLGFKIDYTIKVRLAWVNTPEIRGEERPEGLTSRDWLREKLSTAVADGKYIYIKTIRDKTGKYGRYLGELYIDGVNTVSLNDQLVNEGLAEYKDY